MSQLITAAIDIETTGIAPDDRLTVIGVDVPLGSRLFLNTGGRGYDEACTARIDADFDRAVQITPTESETGLLEAFEEFATKRFRATDDETADAFKFAAYNGETWNGGFDLPFIRTRCLATDVPWPLHGPYIDVMAVVGDRFNVSNNSLETTYAELVGGGLNDADPFEESGEAVECWRAGEFEPLLRHNLADIRRTRALATAAERFCSKSHFSMRSLVPVDSDF